MRRGDTRWVLAFDASCGTCRAISAAVARACDGKLDVLPLSDPDVRRWRTQELGEQAPWTPTLLRTDGARVRAWTGAGMSLPLVRRLGPRSTVRVLHALGQLRREASGHPLEQEGGTGMARSRFLRVGAGAVVAAGLILAGKTPAFAEQSCAAARSWVEANVGRLPQTYREIIAYPMVYRRAIYTKLSAQAKSRFWTDHLRHFRAGRPQLTAPQAKVVDEIAAVAATPSVFGADQKPDETARRLAAAAVAAFGKDQATLLMATLGPADPAPVAPAAVAGPPACECTNRDDWCNTGFSCRYRSNDCVFQDGCGFLGFYVCNGLCELD